MSFSKKYLGNTNGFKKGRLPWNKGKKGLQTAWNKGLSVYTGGGSKKGCISPMKGKHHSEEIKKKIREAKKGKAKSNSGSFQKGKTPWNKGTKGKCKAWNKGIKGIAWNEKRRKAQLLYIPKPRKNILNGKEYHPFWHEIRRLVYRRDGNRCRECGGYGKMNAHHIDYDITNNDLSNLITLCMSCHAKTNFKRLDWINRYTMEMR